ncbi:NAD-dependent epimerase/dehydratase family protein [Thalassoglobus polymorphus]|uniref:UDP-glucose 4-epimerase n=1 Tax=Thalassoglobus polymorphus TaxID=2527994 RepID=A0A517QLA8_9PLAN|nr:NAD-dependent epimerase/dehydratase family protein [Thalassoglobus polymorphus]QDT32428.1 UDP-glucose 4-epimerase [Thalassoglobus polymorphus]
MRILITGGAGFIGGHIAEELVAQKHEVAVLDDLSSGERANVPKSAKFYEADITDAKAVSRILKEFQPESLCHQAAQMSVSRSVREPDFDANVNILGLVNVLKSAAEVGTKRFVFASSGGVLYGEVTEPAPETTPANPISPYGISKWAGEQYLQFFTREHGMETVALRYSNVFGPRQNPHGEAGVVAIFCTKMLAGEPARVNGDGKYVRDYVYVTDVVDANVRALTSASPGFVAYNVGTGVPTDVNQIASALLVNCQAEIRKRDMERTVPNVDNGPARPGDLRSNLISATKIQTELGWSPKTDVTTGLQQTSAWFAQKLLDQQ